MPEELDSGTHKIIHETVKKYREDCPHDEDKSFLSRGLSSLVEVMKIAVLLALCHFLLKLVYVTGTVTREMVVITRLMQDIHDHIVVGDKR